MENNRNETPPKIQKKTNASTHNLETNATDERWGGVGGGAGIEMETNNPAVEQARTEDLAPQLCSCQLVSADSVTQIPEGKSLLFPSRTSDGFP